MHARGARKPADSDRYGLIWLADWEKATETKQSDVLQVDDDREALTFFLDLLRHQELIPLNSGGIVTTNNSHCVLELVGDFSCRNK